MRCKLFLSSFCILLYVESGRISPCRAIDLGCGTGSNAVFLAQRGFEVTAVDFASSAIQKAQRKAEATGVQVEFIMDDLTNLQKVKGTFDFLVDYGTLDDLSPEDRDLYVRNVLRLVHAGTRFLHWCFEWHLRWWERILTRLLPFGVLALEPGEAERRFSEYFQVERVAGGANQSGWPRGFAAYLMRRKEVEP